MSSVLLVRGCAAAVAAASASASADTINLRITALLSVLMFDANALSFPDAEQPPHDDQLADVVGRVIDHQHQFAQAGLAIAVRNRRGQIDLRIHGQPLERLPILFAAPDA